MNAFRKIETEIAGRKNAGVVASIHAENSRNDSIAIALAYLGRASEKVLRNERENCNSTENLVKAAAILCEEIDRG